MKSIALLVSFYCLAADAVQAQPQAQPQARQERLDHSAQHDRWRTRPRDIVKDFRAYTTSFDGPDDNDGDGRPDLWAIPEWVSYELRAGADRPEFEPRPGSWHTVVDLYRNRVAPADQSYAHSGYDRGHLCMRQHGRRLGQNADWNTHSVLNCVPQLHSFNDGHWVGLEMLCSQWSNQFGKVWVICGPVVLNRAGNRKPTRWIGDLNEVRVAVPQHMFKIVVRESDRPDRPLVLAFVYPNDGSASDKSLDADHDRYLVSVRQIESMTGLDFFTSLPQADQKAIESDRAAAVWPRPPRSDAPRSSLAPKFGPAPSPGLYAMFDAEFRAEQQQTPAPSVAPPSAWTLPCSPTMCRPDHSVRPRKLRRLARWHVRHCRSRK